MSGNRKAIAGDVFSLWFGTVLTQFIGLFVAVFIRREIGPELMGVWALVQAALGYSGLAGFVYEGAIREVPLRRGRGDAEGARRAADVAFSFAMAAALAISGGALLFAPFSARFLGAYGPAAVVAFAFLNPLQRWSNFLIGYLYAEKKFTVAGELKWISAAVNAGLTFGLVTLFSLNGFYAAMALSFIFNILYVYFRARLGFWFRWDRKELWDLVALSSVLAVAGALNTFLTSLDRVAIARALGLEKLGIYTLGTMGAGFFTMFAFMFLAVLNPRLLERYGKTGRAEDVMGYGTLPGLFVAAYLVPAIGAIWAIAPWLTHLALPKYAPGLEALKMLLLGAAALTLVTQQGQMMIALNRQNRMVGIYLAALALHAALLFLVGPALGWPLSGYALASAASYFAVFAMQAFAALAPTIGTARTLGYLARIGAHLTAVWTALALMDRLWPATDGASAVCRAAFFVPLALVSAWAAEPLLGILAWVRQLLAVRVSRASA